MQVTIHFLLITNSNLEELDKNFEWTLLGSVTGTTPIVLPLKFSEITIIVHWSTKDVNYAYYLCKAALTEKERRYFQGFNNNAGSQACIIKASISQLYCSNMFVDNNDVTSSAIISVYYR